MRVLLRSYDLHHSGEAGERLRALRERLVENGEVVWATDAVQTLDEIRTWRPDVIVSQNWAVEEASHWATTLRIPFVMLVHGPGQYEHFMPQCDMVVFAGAGLLEAARDSLGAAPHTLALDVNDLRSIASAGRRKPTISLCMTVANESAMLEKAVASVAGFVDAIIIGVDRKSGDNTADIARRLATDYFEYLETSPPDFPRMRNRALERVQTDWAIVLDGHEWIENPELIRQALETTAWSIEIQTLFEPDENRVPSLSFAYPRIHRRHVRFVGAAAHEEVSTPIERRVTRMDIQGWREQKVGLAAAARNFEKRNGELEALRAAWTSNADRRALFYLANGLRESERYAEAIDAYDQYLAAPNFPEEGWQATLFAARCHAALKDWPAARRRFEEAIVDWPERAEPAIGLGYALLETGQVRAAAAWFRMAASLPQPLDCRLFVEVPAYHWHAWHGLALALDRLGDYAGALDAERKAIQGGAGRWAERNVEMWLARTKEDPVHEQRAS